MKKSIDRILSILKDKKGELLLEGIISVLIFSLFMMAVMFMIVTSLNITRSAAANAAERQAILNKSVLGEIEADKIKSDTLIIIGGGISIAIPVLGSDEGGYLSFYPDEVVAP